MPLKERATPKTAAAEYIKQTLTDHQRIIFNGNGYADEWEVEAAKRGLANNRNTAEALPAYVADKSVALFGEMGVLSESEIESRYECKLERYCKLINIEARVMRRMTRRTFLPAINGYASEVAASIERYKTVSPGAKVGTQEKLLGEPARFDRTDRHARMCARRCRQAGARDREPAKARRFLRPHPHSDHGRSAQRGRLYRDHHRSHVLASAELQQHVVLRLGFYDKGKQTRLPEETEREEQTSLLFPTPFGCRVNFGWLQQKPLRRRATTNTPRATITIPREIL